MTIHTFSSREFTRDISSAKRAASEGTVFITDRGRPAFALLSIEDYYKIIGKQEKSLLEMMNDINCEENIEFNPNKLEIKLSEVDFE
jgi:prevent-host-death family protein